MFCLISLRRRSLSPLQLVIESEASSKGAVRATKTIKRAEMKILICAACHLCPIGQRHRNCHGDTFPVFPPLLSLDSLWTLTFPVPPPVALCEFPTFATWLTLQLLHTCPSRLHTRISLGRYSPQHRYLPATRQIIQPCFYKNKHREWHFLFIWRRKGRLSFHYILQCPCQGCFWPSGCPNPDIHWRLWGGCSVDNSW